jgi:tetratricopeptide (TPR) repeat protein
MNLARVHLTEGELDRAVEALNRAAQYRDQQDFPSWTWSWLSGVTNAQNGYLDAAVRDLRNALQDRSAAHRGFDFSKDYEVLNQLGQTLLDYGIQRWHADPETARALWQEAVTVFQNTLALDPENATAHYGLQLLYERLGDAERAAEHRRLHQRYKPDDNAQELAVGIARQKYPAANHAAEAVVIYSLQRVGAPELPDSAQKDQLSMR